MKPTCPWCRLDLDAGVVRSLGKLSEPCPHCGKPIRASMWQFTFIVILLLPLIAVTLYLSRIAFDQGSVPLSVLALIGGMLLSIYLQRFVPIVHGPSRGGASGTSRKIGFAALRSARNLIRRMQQEGSKRRRQTLSALLFIGIIVFCILLAGFLI